MIRLAMFILILFTFIQVEAGFKIMPSDSIHEVDIVQIDFQSESIEMSQADILFDYGLETMVADKSTEPITDSEIENFVGYGLAAKMVRLSITNRDQDIRQFYLLE